MVLKRVVKLEGCASPLKWADWPKPFAGKGELNIEMNLELCVRMPKF